jgi:SAM-dependent methyltransferase
VKELDLKSPRVLEIGPGAVSKLLVNKIAPGEGDQLSRVGNRYRALLRNLDGLVRRLPNMELRSYEPGELLSFLPADTQLTVADISERVIEAIQNQYPQACARVMDLTQEVLDPPADVIVCLCVLTRAREPGPMFANLYRSLRPGGLLVMDNRSCSSFGDPAMPLEKLAAHIWRK